MRIYFKHELSGMGHEFTMNKCSGNVREFKLVQHSRVERDVSNVASIEGEAV